MWVEWGQRAEACFPAGDQLQGPPSAPLHLLPRYTGISDRRPKRSTPKPERTMELRGSARNYFGYRRPNPHGQRPGGQGSAAGEWGVYSSRWDGLS